MIKLQTETFHSLRNKGTAIFTVENNIGYDNDLSQHLLAEFLSGDDGRDVQSFGRRQTEYLVVYHESVSLDDKHFKLSTLNAKDKDELVELAYSIGIFDVDESMDKLEVFEVLANVTHEDYYKGLYNENSFYDLDYDTQVRGYCQGDIIAIKFVGDFAYEPSEYIKNIYFDTAIDGSVELMHNGEVVLELPFGEYTSNLFEWNKAKFIEKAVKCNQDYKHISVLKELLEEELPEELQYSY